MIIVRNVFRVKFGKPREALSLFREGLAIGEKSQFGRAPARLLTDVVATF
jgi:hypothetical protein